MNNIYDVLEICLQELENGVDLKTILARYPDLANELRPILKASIMARTRNVAAPSPDAVRRGRAKLLQHASEMREAKAAPRKRMIPFFQRLAISFSLTAVFLASGTGLVGASSNALPGENLYRVKRTWEDVRLFFTFNPGHKEWLESEFESERLHEVDELLVEGRHETIQFAGVFMQVNGVTYVSGVTVLVPANLQAPADGTAVVIAGRTNAQGFVEIESIEALPEGSVVPVGKPVEVEDASNPDSKSESGSDSGAELNPGTEPGLKDGSVPGSGNDAPGSDVMTPKPEEPQSFEMNGTLQSISDNILIINGQTVYSNNVKIEGTLKPGATVEIKGYYAADGTFIVTEVKVKDSGSGGGNENSGSDSGSTLENSGSSNTDNNGSTGTDGGDSEDNHSGSESSDNHSESDSGGHDTTH